MKMKGFLFMLLFSIIAIVPACGTEFSKENEVSDSIDTLDKGNEKLKDAYNKLNTASEKLCYISGNIQMAWHYGIFEKNASFLGLANKTGFTEDDLRESGISEFHLDEFTNDILAVQYAMIKNGAYDEVEKNISEAKKLLQEVTSDLDNYTDMKNYYSTCNAYYEWVKSPDGNFNQATTTINDYEKELKDFRNDMEFDYGI